MVSDGGRSSRNEQNNQLNSERNDHRRHAPQQIQRLEASFSECPEPDESERQKLCQELNLEMDQIKFWFRNKRDQSKVQNERSSNLLLRAENEKIRGEIEAMKETLKSVSCPTCRGPPLGRDERDSNRQLLVLKNAQLKEKREKLFTFISENDPNAVNTLASVRRQQMSNARTLNRYDLLKLPTSQTIPFSDEEIRKSFKTATSAVEELKVLFSVEEAIWFNSPIHGSDVIDQNIYEKFFRENRPFKSFSARVESSKDVTVVPIDATHLIQMFLDAEKWKNLFSTIVTNAKTFPLCGSDLPTKENCNVVQVLREQIHILSPIVPPREFVVVRSCQQIDQGMWIIADVSHHFHYFNLVDASCYKRPSGCLIQALANGHSKVTWIEHVVVDDKFNMNGMYGEVLCGGSGFGAKRWIATLERVCERMTLTSIESLPATDWSDAIKTGEERRNVMKLGERMLKNFSEIVTMSGKIDSPSHVDDEIRVSMRINDDPNLPVGWIVSAASSLPIRLITPLQVFNVLMNRDTRQQWDVLTWGNVLGEVAHISTGSRETNYVSILKQTRQENIDMLILQECYMDALGGMLVYAPLEKHTIEVAISGQVTTPNIPILPSGFIISSDGCRGSTVAADGSGNSRGGHNGGTILTLAFQIFISGRTTELTNEFKEKSEEKVNRLITSTLERIKIVFNVPSE